MKKINIAEKYITLGQMLKLIDCVSSGGMAKSFLEEITVKVNGEIDRRRGRKLKVGDHIEIAGHGSFEIGSP